MSQTIESKQTTRVQTVHCLEEDCPRRMKPLTMDYWRRYCKSDQHRFEPCMGSGCAHCQSWRQRHRCILCGTSYSKKSNLTKHQRTKHRAAQPSGPQQALQPVPSSLVDSSVQDAQEANPHNASAEQQGEINLGEVQTDTHRVEQAPHPDIFADYDDNASDMSNHNDPSEESDSQSSEHIQPQRSHISVVDQQTARESLEDLISSFTYDFHRFHTVLPFVPYFTDLGDSEAMLSSFVSKYLQLFNRKSDLDSEERHGLLVLCIFSGPAEVLGFLDQNRDWVDEEYTTKYKSMIYTQLRRNGRSAGVASWILSNLEKYDEQTHKVIRLLQGSDPSTVACLQIQSSVLLTNLEHRQAFIAMVQKMTTTVPLVQLVGNLEPIGHTMRLTLDQFESFQSKVFTMTNHVVEALTDHLKIDVGQTRSQSLQSSYDEFVRASQVVDASGTSEDIVKRTLNLTQRQSKLQQPLYEGEIRQLCSDAEKVSVRFDAVSSQKPKKIQAITAALAVHLMRKRRNVLASVPGGMGKSLISTLAAALGSETADCDHLVMVYCNQYLLVRDRSFIDLILQAMANGKRVDYLTMDELQTSQLTSKSFVLVDEADVLIYERPSSVPSMLRTGARFLFLTATEGATKLEMQVLSRLDIIPIRPYHANSLHPPSINLVPKSFNSLPTMSSHGIATDQFGSGLCNFVEELLKTKHVMVFVKDAKRMTQLASLADTLPEVSRKLIDSDMAFDEDLNLSSLDSGGRKCLLLADPDFGSRGIDVRSSQRTTALIITTAFAHETQYQQALRRVGRNGDPCEHYIDAELMKVKNAHIDQSAQAAYWTKLNSFLVKQERSLVKQVICRDGKTTYSQRSLRMTSHRVQSAPKTVIDRLIAGSSPIQSKRPRTE